MNRKTAKMIDSAKGYKTLYYMPRWYYEKLVREKETNSEGGGGGGGGDGCTKNIHINLADAGGIASSCPESKRRTRKPKQPSPSTAGESGGGGGDDGGGGGADDRNGGSNSHHHSSRSGSNNLGHFPSGRRNDGGGNDDEDDDGGGGNDNNGRRGGRRREGDRGGVSYYDGFSGGRPGPSSGAISINGQPFTSQITPVQPGDSNYDPGMYPNPQLPSMPRGAPPPPPPPPMQTVAPPPIQPQAVAPPPQPFVAPQPQVNPFVQPGAAAASSTTTETDEARRKNPFGLGLFQRYQEELKKAQEAAAAASSAADIAAANVGQNPPQAEQGAAQAADAAAAAVQATDTVGHLANDETARRLPPNFIDNVRRANQAADVAAATAADVVDRNEEQSEKRKKEGLAAAAAAADNAVDAVANARETLAQQQLPPPPPPLNDQMRERMLASTRPKDKTRPAARLQLARKERIRDAINRAANLVGGVRRTSTPLRADVSAPHFGDVPPIERARTPPNFYINGDTRPQRVHIPQIPPRMPAKKVTKSQKDEARKTKTETAAKQRFNLIQQKRQKQEEAAAAANAATAAAAAAAAAAATAAATQQAPAPPPPPPPPPPSRESAKNDKKSVKEAIRKSKAAAAANERFKLLQQKRQQAQVQETEREATELPSVPPANGNATSARQPLLVNQPKGEKRKEPASARIAKQKEKRIKYVIPNKLARALGGQNNAQEETLAVNRPIRTYSRTSKKGSNTVKPYVIKRSTRKLPKLQAAPPAASSATLPGSYVENVQRRQFGRLAPDDDDGDDGDDGGKARTTRPPPSPPLVVNVRNRPLKTYGNKKRRLGRKRGAPADTPSRRSVRRLPDLQAPRPDSSQATLSREFLSQAMTQALGSLEGINEERVRRVAERKRMKRKGVNKAKQPDKKRDRKK